MNRIFQGLLKGTAQFLAGGPQPPTLPLSSPFTTQQQTAKSLGDSIRRVGEALKEAQHREHLPTSTAKDFRA